MEYLLLIGGAVLVGVLVIILLFNISGETAETVGDEVSSGLEEIELAKERAFGQESGIVTLSSSEAGAPTGTAIHTGLATSVLSEYGTGDGTNGTVKFTFDQGGDSTSLKPGVVK